MIDFSYKEYRERIQKLPKTLEKSVNSLEFMDFIGNVSIDYKLKGDLFFSFKQNLYAVMIGLLPPHKFKNELIKDGIDIELAEKISQKTHYYIFRENKEGLQEIYTEIKISPKGEIIKNKEEDNKYGMSVLEDSEKIRKRVEEIEEYKKNDPYAEKI